MREIARGAKMRDVIYVALAVLIVAIVMLSGGALLHISRPPRRAPFSYVGFFFEKKKNKNALLDPWLHTITQIRMRS